MEKFRFTDDHRSGMEKMAVPFAVYQFIDSRVVTLVLSDGFCKLFGYDDIRAAYYDMDHDMYRNTHPDDVSRISDAAVRFATNKAGYDVIYRTRKINDTAYHIIHATGKHVYTASGARIAYVWYTEEGEYNEGEGTPETDLTLSLKKSLHEESMLKASYYDYLTGLPSMSYFFELATAGKESIIKAGGHPVMLFVDLSGMKFYNGKHGFSEGDKVIRALAKMLTSYFGSECCSRFGSDHFAVYTEETGLEPTLKGLFADWQTQNPDSPHLRVGIFKSDLEDVDAGTACDRAKIACDRMRKSRVSAFNYFSETLLEDVKKRQYIIENIDNAINNRWIQVYYQPIVRAVNGRVCDEEALARWVDPVRGILSPSEFIPTLEASGLIYKLDLCVIDQVLEKIKAQQEHGLHAIPQSVNLSRSDFDSCDIVEEIRRRVDDAGVDRELLTIEITESMVGSDFEFIKQQIGRFQSLGFHVWMDDFGSGYSSLDVLQSIKFQLIKFDMSFMRQFGDNSGKIILTELMKMATALGVDTVCEGVETKEQVLFLREIGCSKLQGFYYCKPISFEQILERYKKGIQIGFENPEESAYYETIGKFDLHDLGMIAGDDDEKGLLNYFDTLPMAIIEIKDGVLSFARSNRAYRKFIHTRFGIDIAKDIASFNKLINLKQNAPFINMITQSSKVEGRSFFNEIVNNGATVHMFSKRLGENKKTGAVAVSCAILSVTESDQGTTYANIARALAADYFNLFYVDLETDDFIEYSSNAGGDELAMERHGHDFFAQSRHDAQYFLYKDDVESFVSAFTKENLMKTLEEHGTFTLTYRQKINGEYVHVNMKAMRMLEGNRYIIIGVNGVNSQIKSDSRNQ